MSQNYNCPNDSCDFATNIQLELLTHIGEIHNECTLACNSCQQKFSTSDALKKHTINHKNENKMFEEEINGDEVRSYEFLDDFTYLCKTCHRIFHQKINYEHHKCPNQSIKIQKRRKDNTQESLDCRLCDKDFKSLAGLKYHLKRHVYDDQKSFKCPYCDKLFLANVNLNHHIKSIHSNIRQFKCNICNPEKTFATLDHYNKHLAMHQNARKFKCNHCELSFLQSSHLKSHIQTKHEKIKFNCDSCNKQFNSNYNLQGHRNRMHKSQTTQSEAKIS